MPNRRGFFNALAPWMALARRPGLPTALVLLDLDQFKRVNDSYGHPAGDAVLRAMVEVCKQPAARQRPAGPHGGRRIRAAAAAHRRCSKRCWWPSGCARAIEATPVKTERAMITMTASFGVTTIRADDSTVSLFQRADEALRAAKQGGRNKVVRGGHAGRAGSLGRLPRHKGVIIARLS